MWGAEVETAVCEHCDWSYLLPRGKLPQRCPHCFQVALAGLGDQANGLVNSRPPELLLPFTVSAETLDQSIRDFAGGIPFPPDDLNPQNLRGRLQRIYLPMWLVDAEVQATWQAEAGFDYQVVSHQDRFDGGWVSQEVTETRIRWEPRVGRLTRTYHNIAAPALEEDAELKQQLGEYDTAAAQPYSPEAVTHALLRLPTRPPADASRCRPQLAGHRR
jgi:hypothetical protein